ncbi:MAG: heavy metal translocating P-type ATPase [Gemmatimonadota bacterium]
MSRTEIREPADTGRAILDTCILPVEGLDCASCASSVRRALTSVSGVEDVQTDVVNERVTVSFEPRRVGEEALKDAVRAAGYRVREDRPAETTTFRVDGLCCATEARQIEDRLGGRADVTRLHFDYVGKRMTVEGQIPPEHVRRVVTQLGMSARRVGGEVQQEESSGRRMRLLLVTLAGILWLAALLSEYVLGADELVAVFAIAALATGGRYIVPRGIRTARNRALDMNFLMSIAAVGALLIGEYLEGASAMFLFALAQMLEARSMDRARNAIRGLMDLSPATASVLRRGVEVRVAAAEVRVGETVVVRPGEKIPVDGAVSSGRSSVNQAPITGESVPVEKEPGGEVFAGTLNGEGVLEVRSGRPAEDTTLARIIHSVEEAQANRAPSQTFVDRFARIYTPAVVIAAAATALLPPLLGLGAWDVWIYRSLVLLVVACPCALVISTPVTIVSALAGAARRGILIKGGLHLENAGRANVVALDKTGTLTRGEPSVVDVRPFDGSSPEALLASATAAETRSEHPLARAILRHAAHLHIEPLASTNATAIAGKGMRAEVDGRVVHVGTERLFRELGVPAAELRGAVGALTDDGRTVVLVGSAPREDGPVSLQGMITIADRVRPRAADALKALHDAGIKRIVMLTGDNPGTARAVAESLPGIDEYRAELLPHDKVHVVRELRERHGRVAFVGDGINDAPALAAADVGIAMGSAGTDIALETADIALMADDLEKLALTIRIARKSEGIIRFNIGLALLTKAAFVALAVGGWATLWMAVVADMGTSLLVIMNGMRAMKP